MTKGDLINAVAEVVKTSKRAAQEVVNATFAKSWQSDLKDQTVQVPGFGTFSVKIKKSEERNKSSICAAIKIKASRTVGFKPAPSLKKGL